MIINRYEVAVDFSSVNVEVDASNEAEAIEKVKLLVNDNLDEYHNQTRVVNIGEYVDMVGLSDTKEDQPKIKLKM